MFYMFHSNFNFNNTTMSFKYSIETLFDPYSVMNNTYYPEDNGFIPATATIP
jgi:hypothetical protein